MRGLPIIMELLAIAAGLEILVTYAITNTVLHVQTAKVYKRMFQKHRHPHALYIETLRAQVTTISGLHPPLRALMRD